MDQNFAETIVALLEEKFSGKREPAAKWDACVVIPKEYLHNAVEFLKNDPSTKMDMLLDAAGISRKDFDISNYSGLTARELRIITDAVIKTYGRKEGA